MSPEQIDISTLIDRSCHRCYGRGYVGIDSKTKYPVICQCVRKNYRKLKMQSSSDNAILKAMCDQEQKRGAYTVPAIIHSQRSWIEQLIEWLLLRFRFLRKIYNPGMKYAR
jgi:hypothetical protein